MSVRKELVQGTFLFVLDYGDTIYMQASASTFQGAGHSVSWST